MDSFLFGPKKKPIDSLGRESEKKLRQTKQHRRHVKKRIGLFFVWDTNNRLNDEHRDTLTQWHMKRFDEIPREKKRWPTRDEMMRWDEMRWGDAIKRNVLSNPMIVWETITMFQSLNLIDWRIKFNFVVCIWSKHSKKKIRNKKIWIWSV